MQIVQNSEAKEKYCWRNGGLCKGSGCMGWEFVRHYDSERREYYQDESKGFCSVNPK